MFGITNPTNLIMIFLLVVVGAFIYDLAFAYRDGIKIHLTKKEVKKAIYWGGENKDSLQDIVGAYSFYGRGKSREWGTIGTKIFRLATLSCVSAQENKELDQADIEEILINPYLAIMLYIFESNLEFLEKVRVVLKQGEKIIEAKDMDSSKSAEPGKYYPYYTARVIAFFPYSDIDPKAKTTIILIKDERESRFEVDFSRYK